MNKNVSLFAFRLAILVLVGITSLSISSCSKDSDDSGKSAELSQLLGSWANTQNGSKAVLYFGADGNGFLSSSDEVLVRFTYEITSSGIITYKVTYVNESVRETGISPEDGQWKYFINGNSLYMDDNPVPWHRV